MLLSNDGALQPCRWQRGTGPGRSLWFNLEHGYEKANREEAERKVAQAQANLDDAKTVNAPTELHTIQAH